MRRDTANEAGGGTSLGNIVVLTAGNAPSPFPADPNKDKVRIKATKTDGTTIFVWRPVNEMPRFQGGPTVLGACDDESVAALSDGTNNYFQLLTPITIMYD